MVVTILVTGTFQTDTPPDQTASPKSDATLNISLLHTA